MVCSDGLYTEGNNMMMPTRTVGFAKQSIAKPITSANHTPDVSFEDERAVIMDLMRASQRTLAPLIEKDTDIYTLADLKVRF